MPFPKDKIASIMEAMNEPAQLSTLNRTHLAHREQPNRTLAETTSEITTLFQGSLENNGYFDNLSANQTIGVINYILKGDNAVFENNTLNINDYNQLRNLVETNQLSQLIGGVGRIESGNFANFHNDDKMYLFAESIKRLLTADNQEFSEEEKNEIKNTINNVRVENLKGCLKNFIAPQNNNNFSNITCDQAVGLVNYILKKDPSIFTEDFTINNYQNFADLISDTREGNTVSNLDNILTTGTVSSVRRSDTNHLNNDEKIYLFGEALKEVLINQNNFNDEEKERIAKTVKVITNPSMYEFAYESCSSFFNSKKGKEIVTATTILGSDAAAILWGVNEGFPINTNNFIDTGNSTINTLCLYSSNALILLGLLNAGHKFGEEVLESLSGTNPLGKRIFELGSAILGSYVAHRLSDESLNESEVFHIFGAAMISVASAAAISNFYSRLNGTNTEQEAQESLEELSRMGTEQQNQPATTNLRGTTARQLQPLPQGLEML